MADEIHVPATVFVVSAHWFTKGTKLTAMDFPKTIHDFGGFPQQLFDVINTKKQSTPVAIPSNTEQYTLTSIELQGRTVQHNGQYLKLGSNDELPAIKGNAIKSGNVTLPAISISFFAIADAGIKISK